MANKNSSRKNSSFLKSCSNQNIISKFGRDSFIFLTNGKEVSETRVITFYLQICSLALSKNTNLSANWNRPNPIYLVEKEDGRVARRHEGPEVRAIGDQEEEGSDAARPTNFCASVKIFLLARLETKIIDDWRERDDRDRVRDGFYQNFDDVVGDVSAGGCRRLSRRCDVEMKLCQRSRQNADCWSDDDAATFQSCWLHVAVVAASATDTASDYIDEPLKNFDKSFDRLTNVDQGLVAIESQSFLPFEDRRLCKTFTSITTWHERFPVFVTAIWARR